MHWLRAHRVADGADGKMGAPADALRRPRCPISLKYSIDVAP